MGSPPPRGRPRPKQTRHQLAHGDITVFVFHNVGRRYADGLVRRAPSGRSSRIRHAASVAFGPKRQPTQATSVCGCQRQGHQVGARVLDDRDARRAGRLYAVGRPGRTVDDERQTHIRTECGPVVQ